MLILTLLSLSAASSTGGVEYLAFDLELSFEFSGEIDDAVITFDLKVPGVYFDMFGWIGIALQDVLDAMDDFRVDYYIALTSDGIMTDRYGELNDQTDLDVDQGCTSDIEASMEEDGEYKHLIWSRSFDTGDPCDVKLIMGKPIMVKYAMGPVVDGVIEQHSMKYMGYEYMVLSVNYWDNNEDERTLYGPWHTIDHKTS